MRPLDAAKRVNRLKVVYSG